MPWGPGASSAHRRDNRAQTVRPSVRLSLSLSFVLLLLLLLLLLLSVCQSGHGSASRALISGTSGRMSPSISHAVRLGGLRFGALRHEPTAWTGPPLVSFPSTIFRCPSWRPSSPSSTSQRHHGFPRLHFFSFCVHHSCRAVVISPTLRRVFDWGRSRRLSLRAKRVRATAIGAGAWRMFSRLRRLRRESAVWGGAGRAWVRVWVRGFEFDPG